MKNTLENDYLNTSEVKHLDVFFLSQKKLNELTKWVENTNEVQTVHENTIRRLLKGRLLITQDYELIVRKAFEIKNNLEAELKELKKDLRL